MDKQYKIVFVGPPGSGKGTQAHMLAERLEVPLLGTGALFRAEVAQGTPLGQEVAELLDHGRLVPDAIATKAVDKALAKIGKNFVLDGYPRNVAQAEHILAETGGLTHVFEIALSDEEAMNRISGRQACPSGHIFHAQFKPPQKQGVCDICQGELSTRSDSTMKVTQRRLRLYREETEPVLDYFRQQGIEVLSVQGKDGIEAISEQIRAHA